MVSVDLPDGLVHNPVVGEYYDLNVVLDTKELNDKGIGVEMVITKTGKDNKETLFHTVELQLVKSEGSKLYYHANMLLELAGSFKYGFRMFPKNADLPHRQDFCYVRWI